LPHKYVAVDGAAVHFLHTGPTTLPDVPPALDRGRLLVLLHGAGGTAGLWRRQLVGLGERLSALAPDLPGHGRSSGIEGLPSIGAAADFLARFVDAVRLRPLVLVGRDMGAAVAMTLAARHPSWLQGLVLACAGPRFPIAPARLARLGDVVRGRLPQQFTTEAFSPATGMEVMREAWTEQVRTDPRVAHGDLLACRAFDAGGLLDRIRVPTLVVAGADDQLVPVALAEELACGIAGARLEVIARAGHQVPLEQADEFNRLVGRFAGDLA
jgi:pimeloyl-ACP methyl ester carboxylesterase